MWFEEPAWLWALLGLPAVLGAGAFILRGGDLTRTLAVLAARAALLLALVVALARPVLFRDHQGLSVVALLDVSASVRRFAELDAEVGEKPPIPFITSVRGWLRRAAESSRPDDRLGIVVFGGRSAVVSMPRRGASLDDDLDQALAEGTDIASAIRLGAALLPRDSLRRLLLISDGNQTTGDALAAAREVWSASGRPLPIDVLPLPYVAPPDVRLVRLEAPAAARPGQVVTLRAVLESAAPVRGRLELTREGEILDLDPDGPDTALRVELPAGASVHRLMTVMDDRPVQRFVATFLPEGGPDSIPENDRADAVISNPAAGAVLVLHGGQAAPGAAIGDGATESSIVRLLRTLNRAVVAGSPEALPESLMELQSFDLIILDDVAAAQIGPERQAVLAQAVDRLGAGLIMGGGPNSFGAGGWRGTPLEPLLPVLLDLPKSLRAPRSALILVLDKSGSMAFPVAGSRSSQQQVANEAAALAIESLATRSLVGVVAFDQQAEVIVPLQPNDDPQAIAEAVRRIRPQGGTDIAAGLGEAQRMLAALPADSPGRSIEKRVVLLTDGRSRPGPVDEVVAALVAQGASLTTIAVGDDTDESLLRSVATRGGGRFYPVRNPRILPRVLVESVQMANRSLIREVPFVPLPQPTGSRLQALLADAPALGGLVLTARRPDPTAVVEWVAPATESDSGEESDPLLAHWSAGLGKVVAFTSSIDEPWARGWLDWPGWSAAWSELIRLAARPALRGGLLLETQLDDDQLTVLLAVERPADDEPDSSLNPDLIGASLILYGPQGRPLDATLRRSGPRTFSAKLQLPEPGAYVLAVAPTSSGTPLAPLVAGITRQHGEEFRRLRSDIALLREIAEATGGRLLSLDELDAARLLDRTGMAPIRSERGVWPWLVWLAVALLIMDVATRRIAWSPSRWRAAIDSTLEGAKARGAEGAATVARLRSVGARGAAPSSGHPSLSHADPTRRGASPSPQPLREGANEPTPAPDRPDEDETSDASSLAPLEHTSPAGEDEGSPARRETALQRALDSLRGGGGRRATTPSPPDRSAADQPEKASSERAGGEHAGGPGSATASLHAAKKRAQERFSEGRGDSGGPSAAGSDPP